MAADIGGHLRIPAFPVSPFPTTHGLLRPAMPDAASPIHYTHDRKPTVPEFASLLHRAQFADRRPVNEPDRLAAMLDHANLICCAWSGDVLVGIARSVTDFAFCCYLSDLAVDAAFQRQGLGVELIRRTQSQLHPACKVILLSAPAAVNYYPKIGMTPHPSAWLTPAEPLLPPWEPSPSNSTLQG